MKKCRKFFIYIQRLVGQTSKTLFNLTVVYILRCASDSIQIPSNLEFIQGYPTQLLYTWCYFATYYIEFIRLNSFSKVFVRFLKVSIWGNAWCFLAFAESSIKFCHLISQLNATLKRVLWWVYMGCFIYSTTSVAKVVLLGCAALLKQPV